MAFEGIPDILRVYFPDLEEYQHAKTLLREGTYQDCSIPCTGGEVPPVRAETHSSDTIFLQANFGGH
jgi:hypothetical protein